MAPLPISDDALDPPGLVARLPEGYTSAVAPAEESRLGRMLARLAAAFEAAAVVRPVPAGVPGELIALVPRLRRYAVALTSDPEEADDLVQSTLLRAWEKREYLPDGPALAAWLFAVLRRTYRHERRRGGARAPEAKAVTEAPERSPVRDAVDRLSWAQREALLLVTIEGLSREAAAAITDCSVEDVRERLDQANDRLARDLGPG